MDRNSGAEGDSPSPEHPHDRIHYLLPPGCSDITDKWALEKRPRPPVREARTVESYLKELWLKAEPSLSESVQPQAEGATISVRDLAQILRTHVFRVIKAAIELKLFLKPDSLLSLPQMAAICKIIGVEPPRIDPSTGSAGA